MFLPTPRFEEKRRFLDGDEALNSQCLPTTDVQAATCSAPKLCLDGLSSAQKSKAAGNSMSAPCVGAMLCVALLALEQIQ